MNIKLPNLDINIDEGLDNKEILQQILDAINKQRKELNFYLMNLNENNMPTIAGRMEDIEGNISLIDQNIDEILLLVANNAEDIAALSVRADQIQAQVANNAGDIAALSIRADQIQAQVTDNAGNIASLSLRADEIAGRVADAENNISQLVIRADEIETVVVDNHEYVTTQLVLLGDEIVEVETTLSNQISTVSQTASQIQTQVSNLVTEVSDLSITVTENYSTLTQRADSIESTVASISQEVSDLGITVTENYSTLTQRADSIESTVSSISYEVSELSTTVTENYSTLTQRADSIESTVVSISHSVDGLEDDMDWAYSQIRQLYNELDFVIYDSDLDGEEIITRINLTPGRAYIDANVIDLRGITTIYAEGDDRTYARFDRYGDFYIVYLGYEIFKLYNTMDGVDIYLMDDLWVQYGALGDIFAYREWTFRDDVYFDGNVYGIDVEPDYRYIIECYYAANKCYIDYGGGNRLTIRNRYGDVVGYISFDN